MGKGGDGWGLRQGLAMVFFALSHNNNYRYGGKVVMIACLFRFCAFFSARVGGGGGGDVALVAPPLTPGYASATTE